MLRFLRKPKDTGTEVSTEKKIKYGGLYVRMSATLIDLFCMTVLLVPLFAILTPLIYSGNEPARVMQPIMQDIAANVMDSSSPTMGTLFHAVTHDERMYNYLVVDGGMWRIGLDQFLQIFIFCSLYLFFWIRVSATPGKMLMGLKIVDENSYAPASKKQLFIRLFGYILSIIPFGLGFFWVVFDKRKQGWHDKLSHTVVIKK